MASLKAEKPSLKAEKPIGTSLFGKKVPVNASEGVAKGPASKPAPKAAAQKPQEPKKKGKGGKPAAKH